MMSSSAGPKIHMAQCAAYLYDAMSFGRASHNESLLRVNIHRRGDPPGASALP
jgi:hypothetical protein